MSVLFLSFVIVAVLPLASSDCTNPPAAMAGFDLDMFIQDKWHVIEAIGIDKYSDCTTQTYKKTRGSSLSMKQKDEVKGSNFKASVTLQDNGDGNPATFAGTWPIHGMLVGGPSDFRILDTDYNTYALLYDCSALSHGGPEPDAQTILSFYILSRTNTLSSSQLASLEQAIEDAGGSKAALLKINQVDNCEWSP